MYPTTAAIALVLLLPACAASPVTSARDAATLPLSRLTVDNRHEGAAYLRATWVDGMEQTSVIPVDGPLYISGSIAGAFPATVEILDADCNLVGRLSNQPRDTQAIITVSATGLTLTPITFGERTWRVAEVVDECRTRPDPP